VRAGTWYFGLGALALLSAAIAAALALVGVALADPAAAGASALCSVVFLIPGLVFLGRGRYLRIRESVLGRIAALAESRGVVDIEGLAEELTLPREDAERLLRWSVREGRLRGTVDPRGRFVAATAPRCRSCGEPRVRELSLACPACGASGSRGGPA